MGQARWLDLGEGADLGMARTTMGVVGVLSLGLAACYVNESGRGGGAGTLSIDSGESGRAQDGSSSTAASADGDEADADGTAASAGFEPVDGTSESTSGPGAASETSAPDAVTTADVSESSGPEVSETGCDDDGPFFPDGDGDGFGRPGPSVVACSAPPGFVPNDDDCNDDDVDVHPGAVEVCGTAVDLDCNGSAPALCTSCLELKSTGHSDADGVYVVDIDGSVGDTPPVEVYCDQSTAGGGWTLIQRTVWDAALTDDLQTSFQQWRLEDVGAASTAAGYRLRGELWDELQDEFDVLLRVDLRQAETGDSCDPLFYEASEGVITIDDVGAAFEGVVSDAALISGVELSATDAGPASVCVTGAADGTPWFYNNCCAACPRFAGTYFEEAHPMLSFASSVADRSGNVESDVCETPAAAAINGTNYRGANTMEFYLR